MILCFYQTKKEFKLIHKLIHMKIYLYFMIFKVFEFYYIVHQVLEKRDLPNISNFKRIRM